MRYLLTDVVEAAVGHPVAERGENAMLRCPLHEDRTPSLSVNLNTGLWVCFSCGEKGTIHKLARICEGTLDADELAIRSAKAQASPYYDEPADFTLLAHEQHGRAKREQPAALVDYFISKGLHHGVFDQFKLGWDGVKIGQPYYDDGKCVAIKYRYPDGHKDSEKGSRRTIYNLDDIRGKPIVIVCEGESDTHAVWSELRRRQVSDEVAVCGIPGASVSRSHWELFALDLMWARKVYMLWDADEAGDKGAALAIDVLGDKAIRVRPVLGKDINDHLLKGGSLEQAGLAASDLLALVSS